MLGKSILVTFDSPSDIKKIEKLGCQVLAVYSQTVLVRGTEDQLEELGTLDFKLSEVPAKSWYTIVERISE